MLKKLAERLGIPSELLHRRKQGFSLPLVHWMRSEMRDGLLSIITEPRTLQRAYFILARFADCLTNISEAGGTMPERCGFCLYSSCGSGIILSHIAGYPRRG
jgi:hypothetical protein